MVHLATASTLFHAQVIQARLGADGIVTDVRGAASTWPQSGPVEIFVEAAQLAAASALLLTDEAEAIVGDGASRPVAAVPAWIVAAMAVVLVACSMAAKGLI